MIILHTLNLPSWWHPLYPSGSDEAKCHVDLYGKELLATQPTACKELHFANTPVSELASRPPQLSLQRKLQSLLISCLQPCETLKQRTQISYTRIPTPEEL